MAFQFSEFLSSLPGRAGYCVDCLSQLYGEPVETIGEYLGDTGIASRRPGWQGWRHIGELGGCTGLAFDFFLGRGLAIPVSRAESSADAEKSRVRQSRARGPAEDSEWNEQ